MKRLLLCIFLFLGCTTAAFAQSSDDDTPDLGLWKGGSLSMDAYLGPDFINGGINSRTGGVISPRINQNSNMLNTNPASLGSLNHFDINIDSRFGMGTWLAEPYFDVKGELNSEITTETNSLFNDPDNFNRPPGSQVIPTEVSALNAGLPGGIRALSVSYPVHDRVSIAAGYTNSVLTNLNMRLNGITTKLKQTQGSGDVSVRFDALMDIDAYTAMSLEMRSFSAGFGAKVFDSQRHEVMLGGTFSQYHARNERYVNADLSGMVVVGLADQRFFNNPNDPNINFEAGETNRLYFSARGEFTDQDYGLKGGLYYRYDNRWGLSVVYAQKPNFVLEDPNATSQAYLPVFLKGQNLFADELEVELDELQTNKPNLTSERNISEVVKPAEIRLPSYVGVGVDIPIRNHTLALNYQHYISEFRIALGDDAIGKRNAMGAGLAFDFKHTNSFRKGGWALIPFRLLLLDIDGLLFQALKKYTDYRDPHINLGGSVMIGDGYAEGATSSSMRDLLDAPTPLGFNLGRRYTVFEGIRFGFNLMNYPNFAFTYSVGVSL